ncbi:hypothetical protein DFQ27_000972 [Actinomortierella ambigua]|uniref:Uncharacterized protein n=1 Tax=Actinomortierella ambigua TaxID=1343610 RepID=A0A9P6QIS6_9FUNG|nr:hypothetical protein DFQ27_000972 [Actinomortierella ambigua]
MEYQAASLASTVVRNTSKEAPLVARISESSVPPSIPAVMAILVVMAVVMAEATTVVTLEATLVAVKHDT